MRTHVSKLAAASSLLALVACGPAAEPAPATDSSALTQITSTLLRSAQRGPLHPGAAPLTGTAKFATFSFWANAGETFHLDVSGPAELTVYRTVSINHPDFTPGTQWPPQQNDTFHVATSNGPLDLAIDHTGYHFLAIGAPDAEAEVAYSVASTVTRRHETTGIKSVASANYRACAVLANGKLKCWGFSWGNNQVPAPDQRPGATLASMGNATPTIALPAKAEDVTMIGVGALAKAAALLEDGTVAAWVDDAAPVRLPLAGRAKRTVRGSCALLEDEKVQCWAHEPTATGSYRLVTSDAWSWPGRKVLSVTASEAVACVVLDGDEVACAPLRATSTPVPTSVPLAPGEHVRGAYAGGYEYGILTDSAVHLNDFFLNSSHRWTHATTTLPATAFVDIASPGQGDVSAVTPDGEIWNGYLSRGVLSWKPGPDLAARVRTVSVHHAAANSHTCALVEGGRAKCYGSYNIGQLGLGDLVSREPSDPEAMGENLPALDLGN